MGNYAYDGLERMSVCTTQNMTPTGITHYMYDRSGRLIAEATGAGAIQREYVWIDDMPLALFADMDTSSPKLWYMHPDHLGRPVKMTDAGKAVVWNAWYGPFGEARYVSGVATNNLRLPGQYYLAESGLHYNWHRYYDPTVGRYIQPDPLEFIDGGNLYVYAGGNPVNRKDPLGLATQVIGCGLGLPIGGPIGCGVGAGLATIATLATAAIILSSSTRQLVTIVVMASLVLLVKQLVEKLFR